MFHNNLKRFSALTLAVLTLMQVSAFNIKGVVTDQTGDPLPQATIRLLKASADSAFVKGAVTNDNGLFNLAGVNAGKYILEATYIGLTTEYRDINLRQSLTIDTIRMSESSIMLSEVSVTGRRAEITVKEDTVEYTADSYKTQPNAVVEDLLKRLPGVEVSSDGTITANGKTVTKFLVEGKEFFSDDPKVASKNLPVDMIDKLQVVDRKSDLARMTGVDDGEEETVINLTVKKGMQNGWFGNVQGGYGTMGRYKGNFNINRFWNGNQITLLGNFNNVNELGFTDSNGNRFQRFGGTAGINTSQSVGLNFNVGNKEILRVGGNVMYSHTDRYNRTSSEQYLFTDSSTINSGKYTRDRGNNVRADFRMEWKPDEYNTLEFRPRLSFNFNDSESTDSSRTRAGDLARSSINRSFRDNNSKGRSAEYGAELIYNHNVASHPGRSFSIQASYNHSNVTERSNAFSHILYYLFTDSVDVTDKYTDNHTWSDNVSSRVSWTEPLGDVKKGNFLTLSYRIQYRWNNADKLVYEHPVSFPDGVLSDPVVDYLESILSETLSNRFRNTYFNQNIRLGYRHVAKSGTLNVGVSFVPQSSQSEDLINSARNIPRRSVFNVAPFLNYRWKLTDRRSITMRYNGRSSQPSLTQLQPVADVSDPLKVVVGNPDLKPSFAHNLNLRFQDFNLESQRSIMLMADATMTQNSIVSKTTYDRTTGGQTTTYTNVNGNWNAMLMNMVSMPFRNKNWQFTNFVSMRYTQSIGFNNEVRNRTNNIMVSENPSIAFRPDGFSLELRPSYSLSSVHATVSTASNRTVHTYGGSFNAMYYTPFGLTLNSELRYSATQGYSTGYDTKQWMWNASISYQTLRNKALTLSVSAYDILQQRSNISRTVNANYILDSRSLNLTRYIMFGVAYRFNSFGKGNEPSSRNGRGQGHGPGGSGGPGGMGRPGGMGGRR